MRCMKAVGEIWWFQGRDSEKIEDRGGGGGGAGNEYCT